MVKKIESASQDKNKVSKRLFVGEVVSDKMDKTIVVKISRTYKHPLYGKTVTRFKKYKAHDSENTCKIGDKVEIIECKPLSKTKHMKLNRIVKELS